MSDQIPQGYKRCTMCGEVKPLEMFALNNRNKSGRASGCKICRQRYYEPKTDRRNKPLRDDIPDGMRQCTKCYEVKPFDMFSPSKLGRYGLTSRCKACMSAITRAAYQAHPRQVEELPDGMKRCSRCGKLKPFDAFAQDRSRKSGLTTSCKDCQRIYREANIERTREYGKGYRARNADKLKQNKRVYYFANREAHLKKMRERREANPDYMRTYRQVNADRIRAQESAYHVAYYHANKDTLLENMRLYRAANREKLLAQKRADYRRNASKRKTQVRAWAKANPEKVQVYRHNRRARLKATPGHFTARDIADIHTIQQGHCCYCYRIVPLTIEHIIPVTREGTSNDPWNIALACHVCNSSKGDKLLEEWTDRWYLREEAE